MTALSTEHEFLAWLKSPSSKTKLLFSWWKKCGFCQLMHPTFDKIVRERVFDARSMEHAVFSALSSRSDFAFPAALKSVGREDGIVYPQLLFWTPASDGVAHHEGHPIQFQSYDEASVLANVYKQTHTRQPETVIAAGANAGTAAKAGGIEFSKEFSKESKTAAAAVIKPKTAGGTKPSSSSTIYRDATWVPLHNQSQMSLLLKPLAPAGKK